ncbi:MAG TPA: ABC transporter ATP-binding protein [Candidatus Saccharimonadales bacterium]|nr:ABC transporter ATP-binding protein [Candidatus Saccharimonadales bacterium]
MSRSKAVDLTTIQLFWQAGLRNKRLLLLALLYPVGAILISTIVPLLVGKIIAAIASQDPNPGRFIPYFVLAAGAGVLANRYGFSFLLAHQAKTMSYLQQKALETLLRRSVGFHNDNIGGKLVSDAIDYPAGYSQLANAIFINIIPFAVVLITGSVLIIAESWKLGVLVSLMAVVTVTWGVIESRGRSPLRKQRLKATKAVTAHLADAILNVQTVKTFAHETDELNKHKALNKTLLQQRLHDWQLAAYQGSNRIAALLFMQLAFIVMIIHLVSNDPGLLGIGIFAFSFTITLSNKLFEVNSMIRNIEDGLLNASPMTEIIMQEPEIRDTRGAKSLEVKKGTISFDNVDFAYKDTSATDSVFAGLQLSIKSGEKIGLVGQSGGGKSTLTRLLLRFEDINDGQILIDGQNIAEVTQSSLRQAISYVPQEPLLFHRTIRENIAYGDWDASLEDVQKAAKKAHAHEFIQGLQDGYDTIVGERGVKLSGGQRQRIAIARAILKNAPLLILDEATSALDSESEVLIQEALWDLMKGRTTIVIAHRLSTIQKMDRIIVLDDGKIVEQGSHKELVKQKGHYAKLWAHQSGGFIEE